VADERWQRVKALFQDAVERPAAEREAFLASAAAGDDALRREVESLLASDAADAGFLDRLAEAGEDARSDLPTLVRASTGQRQPLPILDAKRRIGSFEIVGLLGAGAMGEVYRARDTKLNRDVALKILPALLAFDPDRLARFRREAQLLATLNHPNIAAIYGFEDSSDVPALVLELVDGPTLADRIALGPLPLNEVLAIGSQIADAVEEAHEKGIIHRDLKPANIKIDGSGKVKVLDFGLAKAASPDSTRPDLTGSHEGLVLGTPSYMSPEQARGVSVDKRSDIWAFGCVLYEMLTGRPAFPGATVSDTIAKILEREPDWSALPAATPAPVRRLLLRCLAKHPRQRMRDIGDARIEIDAIDEALPGLSEPSTVPAAAVKARATWLAWVALVALAAGVGVWEARRPVATREDPLAHARFTRFTDWEGTETSAEISPDGKFVAFLADRAGQLDVWLGQVGTGQFRNLTADIPPLEPFGGRIFRKLGFSGDGAEIWFSPQTGPSMAQMILPLMGGMPRAFLDRGATAPAWSPDGTRLTYFKNEDGDPLFVADRTGADARQVLVEKGVHLHNPAWSSDGRWIYFARGSEPTDAMDVWRVRPTGESLERLTEGGNFVNFVAPLDARNVLYVGRAEDRSGPWLWRLDVERKETRRVSTGVGQYTTVSASRDGRRVVATVANPTASLWRVPLLDHEAGDRDVRPYPLPTARALAPRFAGTSLFYLSTSGTGDGLWRVQDGQAYEISKGTDGGLYEPPAVTPDGRHVALVVRREGKRQLVVVSADGRSSRTLAPSLEVEGQAGQAAADWSPDGSWIVTGGRDAHGAGLFKIPVDGGVPVRLVTGQAINPVWSPNGDLIVYGGKFFTGQVDLLGVRPDGTPVEMPAVRARPGGYRFLPDGTGMVYLPFISSLDFWLVDLATRTPRQLTRLGNQGALGTFDITPDGKAIVFDRSRENSDIVLIELPRP
jgi:Tol biopolymer transport system component